MKKVLVANRGEIAIRIFRACTELGIPTVGIYAIEDEESIHRFKADEAYVVGEGKKPIDAYLDIEDIIRIAKETGADAIHPGYGLLSENLTFAMRCEAEGIKFIGPSTEHLDMFGDKIKAKEAAISAGLQSIPGSDGPVTSVDDVYAFGQAYGYPVMIKAALGGGGRGMRIVQSEEEVADAFHRASSEAKAAFGSDEVYVEKYIQNPKHIEVQILGDEHGNVVHLFERDCSIQRRHQKVVEIAPCISLPLALRQEICDAAVQLMKHVAYYNAGTVEFLVEGDKFYFIEVNPRVQVEHTITEMITDIDIVVSQIEIAQGKSLAEIGIPEQADLTFRGAAIQCRITTEDPSNDFMPDTGKIDTYRSPGGMGIRLDVGNAYAGAEVTPYFDSLLVKVCTYGNTFNKAVSTMQRALKEFRIRGVKTNIRFLENVLAHDSFQSGEFNTTFIDTTPELFDFPRVSDRSNKMLKYIGEVTINGFPGIKEERKPAFEKPKEVFIQSTRNIPVTAKTILDTQGAEAVSEWVKNQDALLLTDTTFRDAHQSLLATRVRTKDLVGIARQSELAMPHLFSSEMWGGATFDVAYRFLNEDPWERLKLIREAMPNTLLQMLFRGSNAVGYQNYPDNVIEGFIKQAAQNGVDVFRIFDSLNWLPQMEKSIQAVRDNGKIAEGTICYTGDVLSTTRTKYDINYYVEMALELEKMGAHIIGIKDMAGLLKPQAAYHLISALKDKVSLPIHLHTHDTSGNGIITYSAATRAGVDIVDVAISSLSGNTSQPSMGSLYYALGEGERTPAINMKNVQQINHYWESVRRYYAPFENGMNAPHTEVYQHEMPGGQYSNLQQQAKAVGLEDRWDEVKQVYADVNQMFGDIVKVTPSSKVVGDMALFMIQNNLTEELIYEKGDTLSFPDSVVSFFQGDLGQPTGGFPPQLKEVILQGKPSIEVRPGSLAKPIDFDETKMELAKLIGYEPSQEEVLSYIMYPQVFLDYRKMNDQFGEVTILDTPTFFYGMRLNETINIELSKGKVFKVRLDEIGEPDLEGNRTLFFNFNGQRREIVINDTHVKSQVVLKAKAEPTNKQHIGATMPGSVLEVLVTKGESVTKGQTLMVTEAMKMETSLQAPFDGVITAVHAQAGEPIRTGDLLIEISPK
ncbi:pyruvate carboxylase [Vagococcus zengguangii]|uniref:pyruvate carboxylase n=1 Tax=Vagococcus zengguangii TaxID=2571750 RepID=UPI0011098E24|nr:pyruvate carboxylase [Vagococcus zengguangii]TLG80224.1 pyruvate carboxylase [Vagococcus zengguangii]